MYHAHVGEDRHTVDIKDGEGGAKVAEDLGKDAACVAVDKGNGRRVRGAEGIDALRLRQPHVGAHHRLHEIS